MSSENSYTGRLVKLAGTHPYLCTFLICVMINPFFLGEMSNAPMNSLFLEVILTALSAGAAVWYGYSHGKLNKKQAVCLLIISAGLDIALAGIYQDSENRGLWHFAGGCLLAALVYWLSDHVKYRSQMNSFLILSTGFFLKLYYVLGTGVYTRQHDVETFEKYSGHAGYIRYLADNFHLADYDVRDSWQFCHPPLHHTLAAAWVFINENFLDIGRNQAQESVQMLTLFYSMCIMISAYKILRYFRLEGLSLCVPLALVSFHPAFIMFSGSINNDVLSAALVMGSVVCALEWYRNPTMKNIIKTALCIGGGMMAKLTAALVAPPVAFIFLVVFIKNFRTDAWKFIRQFIVFGLICCPLGLWYQVRNYIKWGVPILYVQELPAGLLQNISGMSFKERISDFGAYQFESVFECWVYNDNGQYLGYNEHNPVIALMKNSLFGEFINGGTFTDAPNAEKFCVAFFWISVFMAVVCLVSMIVSGFVKNKMNGYEKVFFISFYVIMILNFYKMAYDYPFTCTLNFRYITPSVIVQILFGAVMFDRIKTNNEKLYRVIRYPVCAVSGIFVFLSALIYLTVCYNV